MNALVGTWKLISFEVHLPNGTTIYPWGKDVIGQVMYSVDGYMAGSFMKGGRPAFISPDIIGGTPQEFETAMKTYMGYAGPYSVSGNRVIHHAVVCLFPNWTGTDIERFFKIEGSTLTLSTPPILSGGVSASAVLVWEKLPSKNIAD